MELKDKMILLLTAALLLFLIISFISLSWQNDRLEKQLIQKQLKQIEEKYLELEHSEDELVKKITSEISQMTTIINSAMDSSDNLMTYAEEMNDILVDIENYQGQDPLSYIESMLDRGGH